VRRPWSSASEGARLRDELVTIASGAAAAIMAVRAGNLGVHLKADHSPVTAADIAAEAVILRGLAGVLPALPVISEESAAPPRLDGSRAFVLVDPLDGTRDFISGSDEFTVNIAVVADGAPVLGVIAAPAQGLVFTGLAGFGAERMALPPGAPVAAATDRTSIATRTAPPDGPVALVSRFHRDPATDAWLDGYAGLVRLPCGSSLKFCRIAEGLADVYPRLSPTSEWDIAAGHAVLAAAGGAMTAPDGTPLRYGGTDGRFPVPGFLAAADRTRWL